MEQNMTEKCYSVTEAMKMTGCSRNHINGLIYDGIIGSEDGHPFASDIDKMVAEREEYISLREYSASHTGKRFAGDKARDRNHLLDEFR